MKVKIKIIKNPLEIKKDFIEIYKSAYQDTDPEYYEQTDEEIENYFNWLCKHAQDGFIFLYFNKKPIGFAIVDFDWHDDKLKEMVAEIHEICIKKEYQNKGLAKFLIEKIFELAKKKKLNHVCGYVGIKNFQSLKFFKKFGFEENEIRWQIWRRIRKRLF
jgi:ribosomal protein S18 acetylase RimI-like enzyme